MIRFFAIALGFTWLLQLPAVLAQRGLIAAHAESLVPLAALGAFGPLVAAVICKRGVRGFHWRWRTHAGWYVVALFGFTAIYAAARVLYRGDAAAWLYPPENAQHVAALIMMPVVEEIGWRGYALPKLQQRYSAIRATIILGAAWAAWHIMMFLAVTSSPFVVAVSMLNVFVGSFVFTWLFNRTKGSLAIAVAAHAGVHLNNASHASPNMTPLLLFTAGLAVVAVSSMILDRRAWREPVAF